MMFKKNQLIISFVVIPILLILEYGEAFKSLSNTVTESRKTRQHLSLLSSSRPTVRRLQPLQSSPDSKESQIEEEGRLKILAARRGQIRETLKAAESLRNFRIKNGYVPELDEDGKPIKSDGKVAVAATAFVVAGGAIALRVGGRAVLIKAVGLDFLTDNPELQSQLNQVLDYSDNMNMLAKVFLFCGGWTLVKVLCFDAAGVVLALSSGILFGGVLQGAVISAFAATVGSSIAFGMAKADTPVRKKALEVVEQYPSLRGIEKVVAQDGLKAILTLRLAPILPIPIGMYNYVYGVTNVPYLDFAGGIFLGSLKPYLLDSYLGYFGKTIMDGTAANDGGFQDIILLVALGFSILIGVFASQLASETWDSVLQEVETEKKQKGENEQEKEENDGVTKELFGIKFPQWLVGFQYAIQDANKRMTVVVEEEYIAGVWNYTKPDGPNPVPAELDPACRSSSPEVDGANKGINYGESVCDGLVLAPVLFGTFFKYADPLYNETKAENEKQIFEVEFTKKELLNRIDNLEMKTKDRLALIEAELVQAKENENKQFF